MDVWCENANSDLMLKLGTVHVITVQHCNRLNGVVVF